MAYLELRRNLCQGLVRKSCEFNGLDYNKPAFVLESPSLSNKHPTYPNKSMLAGLAIMLNLMLSNTSVAGAIVARALYEGTIDLAQAIKAGRGTGE